MQEDDKMKSIEKQVIHEIEEKKSRFIAILDRVNQKEEVKEKMEKWKQLYPNASHYCYAYIIDQEIYCSDDKEPAKTAGFPILNVLKQQGLDHVCGVVIRYFGGIKLGTGGLVRAYTKATMEALNRALIIDLQKGYLIQLSFPYEAQGKIDYLLKENTIRKKSFESTITYDVEVTKELAKELKEKGYHIQILETIDIKKEK